MAILRCYGRHCSYDRIMFVMLDVGLQNNDYIINSSIIICGTQFIDVDLLLMLPGYLMVSMLYVPS